MEQIHNPIPAKAGIQILATARTNYFVMLKPQATTSLPVRPLVLYEANVEGFRESDTFLQVATVGWKH